MKTKKKIRVLSRIFYFISVFEVISITLQGVYQWAINPFSVPVLPKIAMIFLKPELQMKVPILSAMNVSLQIIGCLAHFTPIVANILVFAFLAVLFDQYKKFNIFSEKVVKSMRNIGYIMLVSTLLSVGFSILTYYLLPDTFILEGRKLQGTLIYGPIGYSCRYILLSVIVIFISWIMKVGEKLEEEQKYTV